MIRFVLASAAAGLALTVAVRAETVAGWEVSSRPEADGTCSVQRSYVDPDDDAAGNAVAITFGKRDGEPVASFVFGYSKWTLTRDERATADLLVGDAVVFPSAKWLAGSETLLVGTFGDAESLLETVGRASEIGLRFDGDASNEAWFEVPEIGAAIAAARVCRDQIP